MALPLSTLDHVRQIGLGLCDCRVIRRGSRGRVGQFSVSSCRTMRTKKRKQQENAAPSLGSNRRLLGVGGDRNGQSVRQGLGASGFCDMLLSLKANRILSLRSFPS